MPKHINSKKLTDAKIVYAPDQIIIRGARVHNLKNIDVTIPKNKLVVITGISGSGKSSLAFDTLYAEGQRRYVESLSSYARQFIGAQDKPDVDEILGLSPAIAIDQRTTSHNPRSTVGTLTEIYDYLRLLFARVGVPHCPNCGQEIRSQSKEQIVRRILSLDDEQEIIILAPLLKDKKGEHKKVLEEIYKAGFTHVRLDREFYPSRETLDLELDPDKKHNLEVVVSRLKIPKDKNKIRLELNRLKNIKREQENEDGQDDDSSRFAKDIELALDLGNGLIDVYEPSKNKEHLFSEHFACPKCEINLPALEPRLFSFNSPTGACPSCLGLGVKQEIDPDLIIPNKKLSLAQGAIKPWTRMGATNTSALMLSLEKVALENNFSLNAPVAELTKKQLDLVLYGTSDFEGVIPNLTIKYETANSDYFQAEIEKYMRFFTCPECLGQRLNKMALAVRVADKNISEITQINISEVNNFFLFLSSNKQKFSAVEMIISQQILKGILERLNFLDQVGLSYLSLNRAAQTLSGGEAQRVRLATQLGAGLSGVLYVLDEPSIGLHQKDNAELIKTLKMLRDLGNSVVVVEHDEQTMNAADYLIDIGPGAGKYGGEIVAQGTPAEIKKNKESLTGQYLAHKKSLSPSVISLGRERVAEAGLKKFQKFNKFLIIKKASEFNLKNIDVKIPLAKVVCITGVSGSGKSTLITEILAKALAHHFHHAKDLPGKHQKILGLEHLDKVITIDQSPIGRLPRSNPATYTGVFTPIRELFAETHEAKIRRYEVGHFSFNVIGGRCEACQGDGLVKIEMHFLSDVYVTCEECGGKRFKPEILDIHYQGKNIAEVLEMTVAEAKEFFKRVPAVYAKLKTLSEVGLDYIQLGQPATTLSGGEAQRVKLATELSRRATGRTLYILDEPTTGLHFADVERLLDVLEQLADKGNTVLVIEHNLDVIKNADWIIDLGPEGGDKGGYLVAEGAPEQVVKVKKSYTGQYLKKALE